MVLVSLGAALNTGLLAKLVWLANSGQEWAQAVDDAVLLHVPAAGFTPGMKALASADQPIRLLGVGEPYREDYVERCYSRREHLGGGSGCRTSRT